MKGKHLLLILIPFFIIFLNLNLFIFNNHFYEGEINENLLNYFRNKEELKFNYTEREIIHLGDVKSLINILKIVLYLLGFLILFILAFSKDVSKILIISGLITVGIVVLLFLIDFNILFTEFHKILFTNDYWLLSEDSLLIKTYPIEFFMNFFKRLILNIIITGLITIGVGIYVHTQYKSSTS